MKSIRLAIVAVGLAAALGAGAATAHGGDEIQWSVTIGGRGGVPVYAPRPAPVHAQPVYPAPVHYSHRYQRPTRWDHDGDGIPNRYDRLYNPRWDRDGDGIPNRYDRYDRDDRYDRYDRGDRHDRHDGHRPRWGH